MSQFISIAGGASAFSSASGGKVRGWQAINDTLEVVVAPANPSRKRLIFHNPGTIDLLVYPTINLDGGVNAPTVANRGGAFLIFANGGTLQIEGECQTPWGALALSGVTNPLTVMDSNV